MPCACKKNKQKFQQEVKNQPIQVITKSYDVKPVVANVQPYTVKTSITGVATEKPQTTQSSDSGYDFTPTVQPLDTCPYCAMKHISLANVLVEYDDNFTAAGQLQCAGYHYNTANKTLSDRCKALARQLITDKISAYAKLPDLLVQSFKLDAPGTSKQLDPGALKYDPVACAVHLATAQSLLFTQIFYQKLNKGYAIGQLILAAVNIQAGHRDIARRIRNIWKIAQQIEQPNDQAYKDAQQAILDTKRVLDHVLQLEGNTKTEVIDSQTPVVTVTTTAGD